MARASAGGGALLAGLALAGWALDEPRLRRLLDVPWEMNPMTAVGLLALAAGVSLLPRWETPRRRLVTSSIGAAVALLGAVQLAAHATGRVPRVDLLLFPERVREAMQASGAGLSVETAAGFLCLGVALAAGRGPSRRALHPSEALALLPTLAACFSLLRYAYRTQPWTLEAAAYLPMAPSTALAFLLLCLGTLAALPGGKLVADLFAASETARTFRRLAIATLVALPIAGYLRLAGERAGLFAGDFGVTLFVVVIASLLLALFWLHGRALLRAEAGLRDALAETARARRELEVQLREVEALNRELKAFSYSVSHDLRAPLRAIDGFSRMLEEDHGPRLDPEGRRLLGVVRDRARHMGRLIDDLLRFSRLSRQALALRPIDMSWLVGDVLDDLRERIAESGAEVTCAPLPAATGDPALLRHVWTNYLDNALKYSAGVERPRVEVGGREEGDEAVYFVRDNGVGFDMAYAGKLFGAFQRLHRAEEFEGTGVGLALVQRIVHRHGGRVQAEASPGKGATFYFTLPLGGVAAAPEEE